MKKLLLIVSVFFLFVQVNQAQTKKIALVIGNASYQTGGVLKNPVNDAKLMETTLKNLGFDVIIVTNATKLQMQTAIDNFKLKLANYNVALFYYAGHGMEINGKNYLIPIDAKNNTETEVRVGSIEIGSIIDEFENYPNNTNIVILDACRNNPYLSDGRGGSRGFVAVTPTSGTIIAFATAPGKTAADGQGQNGLYTQELVKQLVVPQRIEDVFINTRNAVNSIDKNQNPQEWSQLKGAFYFFDNIIDNTITNKIEIKNNANLTKPKLNKDEMSAIFMNVVLKKPIDCITILNDNVICIYGIYYEEKELTDFYIYKLSSFAGVWQKSNEFLINEFSLYTLIDTIEYVLIEDDVYLYFSFDANCGGSGCAGFKNVSFCLFSINENEIYKLNYFENDGEGEFLNISEFNSKPGILNFFESKIINNSFIDKAIYQEDINSAENFEKKWKIENKNIDIWYNQDAFEESITFIYYNENIFTEYSSQNIENDRYIIKTWWRSNVLGFDKYYNQYFSIWIDDCNHFCDKNISFDNNDNLVIEYYENDNSQVIINLEKKTYSYLKSK